MLPELVDPVVWSNIVNQLDEEFGDNTTKSLLGGKAPVVIHGEEIDSIYLIPMSWISRIEEWQSSGYHIHSLGILLGTIVKGKLRLSLQILEYLVEFTDNRIVVSERGAESFTYGRSILKESVVDLNAELLRGQRVLVLNKNGECLGLARLSVDSAKIHKLAKEKLVAKNIVDVGLFLRH
ncbi:MAG: PUA domain-containing protein [Candidatus Hodarchaeota archaeon]